MKTKLMALALLKQLDPTLKFSGWQNGGGQLIAGELRDLAAALEADIAQGGEPYRWVYQVNGVYEQVSAVEPPDDAYDEGTLIALYTTPQEPALKPFDESALYRAAISCGHEIEHQRITLERDDTKPGNALAQLQQRLNKAAFEMAPQEPAAESQDRQLERHYDYVAGFNEGYDRGEKQRAPRTPYGWQVQGLRDTFKGDHAEQDAKAEAARVGGTAYAFPIYIDQPASEDPCYCDKNKLCDPSKSCGDCPRKDYKS